MNFAPTVHPHCARVGYFLLIKFFFNYKKKLLLWINFIGVCQLTESKQSLFWWLTKLDNSNFGVWRENRNRGDFFFLLPPFFALLLQLWEAELPDCFKLLLQGFKISNWKYTSCLSFKLKVQEPQSCFMPPHSCKHSHEAL